jgi:predicted ATP-grasp superfamily ATP-dependent carboligase
MHIFVYEYLSSGAAHDAAALPSLQTEGWAMLSAVLEDLARCPGMQLSTLLDFQRTPPTHWLGRIIAQRIQPDNEEDAFRKLALAADWSLVIAPEFDGILAERSRWVEEAGGRLLGSSPRAIQQTADKVLLSRLWSERGVPTPALDQTFPLVCKPPFGAGSQATFLVHNEEELRAALNQAGAEGWNGEMMLQKYTPGLAASVAFLAGGEQRRTLPAAEQRLSNDGRFRYRGGRLPLPDNLNYRARHLAERAVECVEGLHGWFGVDLVLADAVDGSGDRVIEINPRLTTSYLGLRRLARFNLAEALIAVATGSPPPSWEWKTFSVVFDGGSEGSNSGGCRHDR